MADAYSILESLDQESSDPFRTLETLDQEEPQPIAAEPWWKQPASQVKRGLGLTGRAIVQGVAGLPEAAMNMGVEWRNLVEGGVNRFAPELAQDIYATNRAIAGALPEGMASDVASAVLPQGAPSTAFPSASDLNREALNQFFPEPQGFGEKALSLGISVAGGARLPAPQPSRAAPGAFIPPTANPASSILKEAREAGYVVPPATANPTALNKLLEGSAGKLTTAQAASVKNQAVTNELAKKALGLATDEPITPGVLQDLRATAGKVYEQIADAGDIVPDAQFVDDLAQLGRGADEIASAFPGANVGATKQIGEIVDSLLQEKFSSKAALQYLRELRKQASGNLSGMNAADPAKQALGMAQREAAATLEDLIGRHLVANGQEEIANSFGQARRIIAMSHTVENALNETTGNLIAGKLGQQLAKGKPLSGELETIARFSRAFPKAAKEVTESMPGVSPLDLYTGAGIAAISASAGGGAAALGAAALPFVRVAIRRALLSQPMQRSLTEVPLSAPPSTTLGVLPSLAVQTGSAVNE